MNIDPETAKASSVIGQRLVVDFGSPTRTLEPLMFNCNRVLIVGTQVFPAVPGSENEITEATAILALTGQCSEHALESGSLANHQQI